MNVEISDRRPPLSGSKLPSVKTMNIVFFAHPDFCGHVSLPRFSSMLVEGMRRRGHTVELTAPTPAFYNIPTPAKLKKWMGYIDQYLVFPKQVKKRLKLYPDNTLFVFTDNALGPWVPLVADRPHVVHCHDFMAQQASMGLIPGQIVGWTGKIYQKLIFHGYSKGKNFICGSRNTKKLLQGLLPKPPFRSELVYNGLHKAFTPHNPTEARNIVGSEFKLSLKDGYLLHVGGNQWYKNRIGVIQMYDAWRSTSAIELPLILIGLPPSPDVMDCYINSPFKKDIHFITDASDKILNLVYSGASVFLFPSKSEGFGWPVAEAMASGCPVITTNEAPMTEVAGDAGFFVSQYPHDNTKVGDWIIEAGKVIDKVINLSYTERASVIRAGIENAKRFDTETALSRIEDIYLNIICSREQQSA